MPRHLHRYNVGHDGTVLFERLLARATGEHRDVRAPLRAVESLLDQALAEPLPAWKSMPPTRVIIHWLNEGDEAEDTKML